MAVRKIDLNNFRVARTETVRDINRRLVLNLIRSGQPISRADLARQSGLQRSTVSMITEQLIKGRWVTEGAVGHLPRGRRPTFLHLNAKRSGIVGVDIRPATTLLAVAGLDSQLVAQESIPTEGPPDQFLARLGRRIRDLVRSHPREAYAGIGVSVAGGIDPSTQRLFFSPGLSQWVDVNIKSALERATGLRVVLENSANACALAELWSGRHDEGVDNLVAMLAAEGVGVGMVMNGHLIRGSNGLAGEFGHVVLDENGPQCRCGSRGCIEAYASTTAAIRYYSDSLRSRRRGQVAGKSAMAQLSFDDLLRLAEQADARALEAIDRMGHYLGRAICMVVRGLAPDVLVVVGEVARMWDRIGPRVESMLATPPHAPAATRILTANPDSQPRLRGAIALVLQEEFGAPAHG